MLHCLLPKPAFLVRTCTAKECGTFFVHIMQMGKKHKDSKGCYGDNVGGLYLTVGELTVAD